MVHRSSIARNADQYALQLLRDQIDRKVFLAHRLDRKTAGVLLFTKSKKANSLIQEQFRERRVEKVYQAIVRGYSPKEGFIDYPLKNEGKIQEAQTAFRTLKQFEIDLPFGKFQTSRFSLVELKPQTGRFHQLRKHMAHIFHPIIGDRPHGCNKQNRLWKEQFGMTKMLLHAESLTFDFPEPGNSITIRAGISNEFQRVLSLLEELSLEMR